MGAAWAGPAIRWRLPGIEWLSRVRWAKLPGCLRMGQPGLDQWTVAGIYLDAASAIGEIYDPGIVNPGETMVVRARLQPPVKVGSTNLVTIVTGAGISTTTVFVR